MIDEEEEEKERQRLKKKKVERALKEKDDIDEEEPNWSPPEANEVEKRDRKPNRLRRPELRITRRDELWSDVWMEIILIDCLHSEVLPTYAAGGKQLQIFPLKSTSGWVLVLSSTWIKHL